MQMPSSLLREAEPRVSVKLRTGKPTSTQCPEELHAGQYEPQRQLSVSGLAIPTGNGTAVPVLISLNQKFLVFFV